jgi:hypothetical protein
VRLAARSLRRIVDQCVLELGADVVERIRERRRFGDLFAWPQGLWPGSSRLAGDTGTEPAPAAKKKGAKKEAPVIVFDTIRPNEWEQIYSVFSERYPNVKIDHSEVNTSTRRYVLPLTAFKQGRSVADVITGLSGNAALFRQANALEDLSVLPNYRFMPEHARTPDNITVATRIQYWCMSYNTNTVKQSELPRTWDDLLSPRFKGKLVMTIETSTKAISSPPRRPKI